MAKSLLFILLVAIAVGCTKSSKPAPDKPKDSTVVAQTDSAKLVNKDWYLGHKSTPQMMTIRFNSNDTFVMTTIWHINPDQYTTAKYPWIMNAKDSVLIAGFPVKIISINDTMLVTTNMVYAGSGTNFPNDTFYTY